MAILSNAGNTYLSGDAVTAANLNAQITGAVFEDGAGEATDGTTLEVHSSGYLKIKDGGVDETQLANGAVTSAKLDASFEVTSGEIADNAVTLAKMEHGTAGDVISYNSSGEPVRVSLGAASSYLRVNSAANGVEWSTAGTLSKYSTGWVTSVGGTAVGGAATLTVTHNLATEDVSVNVYVAGDSSGTGANAVFWSQRRDASNSEYDFGALATNFQSNSVDVQLAPQNSSGGGVLIIDSSGVVTSTFWGATNATHIKIVVIG